MFKNYMVTGWRNLRKNKLYSVLNVLGLALGLATVLFVVLYIRFETSYDRFHPNAGRIFRVANSEFSGTPYLLSGGLTRGIPDVEAAVALKKISTSAERILITAEGRRFGEDKFFIAEPSFFRVFSATFIAGDPATVLSHPQSAVLTESTARRYFGTTDCLGRTFKAGLDRSTDLLVGGIVRDFPPNSHFTFNVLAPVEAGPAILNWDDRNIWGSANYRTYLLIRKGSFAALVEKKLELAVPEDRRKSMAAFAPTDPRRWLLQPLTDIHLRSHLRNEIETNGDIRYILLFSAVAILILLSSSLNFINLATAHSFTRCREVGMRKVLGAGRSQIVRQFLGETLLLTAFAAFLGSILIELGFPLLRELTGTAMRLADVPRLTMFAILAVLTVLIGTAAGLIPSFSAASFKPAKTLKGEKALAAGKMTFRNALLVFQFMISLGFVTASIVVRVQMHYLQARDLGIDKDRVINIRLPRTLRAQASVLKAEIRRNPGILSAAATDFFPGQDTSNQSFTWEGMKPDSDEYVRWFATDADFPSTYGLQVIEGRGFAPEDETAGERRFLINESAARRFGWDRSVGKWLKLSSPFGENCRVIGVVKDFNFRSLRHPMETLAIMAAPAKISYTVRNRTYDYLPFENIAVKISGRDIPRTLSFIQAFCHKYMAEDPGAWSFFDEEFGRIYAQEMKLSRMLGVLSLLAALLSGMGVFGLSAFLVERRRKEISIRKILGAAPARILTLFSLDFLALMTLAAVAASPLVYVFMKGWLNQFAYRIVLGPWFFVAAFALMGGLLLAAVGWHSLRAAWANPADNLRTE
jgi:putative ABC transport system permease protein